MYKRIGTTILLIIVAVALLACSSKESVQTSGKGKIQVVVSFNPIREFAEVVGKDKIEIKTIIPAGMEAHDFEPKARDFEDIGKAQIFAYNGLGMEPWVEKSLSAVGNKKLIVVDSSKGFEPIKLTSEGEIKEHGQYDPHSWLSLKGAQNAAKNIKEALVKADPANKEFYEKNYESFAKEAEEVYAEYNKKFSTIEKKDFVTGHAAFGYLCREFGLKQSSVEDIFAEGEPTPAKMKEIVEYCREKKIKTIFVEDMVSPKVSETLAKELGGKAEKIHTLESKEENKNYIEGMKENLEKIYTSLK